MGSSFISSLRSGKSTIFSYNLRWIARAICWTKWHAGLVGFKYTATLIRSLSLIVMTRSEWVISSCYRVNPCLYGSLIDEIRYETYSVTYARSNIVKYFMDLYHVSGSILNEIN